MLDSMTKSKRRLGPRVKQVQPGPRHQVPGGPSGPASRVSRLSPPQLLERIERTRVARDKAEAELVMLIDRAVGEGVGWPEIAARLGVTRQAARQHYQDRDIEWQLSHPYRAACVSSSVAEDFD
jgi:hypothetical protein